MLTINEINGWSLDKCNEELGAASHYSQHNDVSEAREAVVAMATELGVLKTKSRVWTCTYNGQSVDVTATSAEEAKGKAVDELSVGVRGFLDLDAIDAE